MPLTSLTIWHWRKSDENMASRAKTTILMFIVLFPVQVWIPETGKLWSRNTETPSLPVSWTALMEGLSWRESPTTQWMWWTVWWSDEATRCRATPSRGAFPTFTTKMTSKEVWLLVLWRWRFRCQYCINIDSPRHSNTTSNFKLNSDFTFQICFHLPPV